MINAFAAPMAPHSLHPLRFEIIPPESDKASITIEYFEIHKARSPCSETTPTHPIHTNHAIKY